MNLGSKVIICYFWSKVIKICLKKLKDEILSDLKVFASLCDNEFL